MRLDLPVLDLLTALVAGGGVLLGLGVGVALWIRGGEQRVANRFLAGFLVAGGLTLLNEIVVSLELHQLSRHFWITPLLYTFSLGPLIYAFVRARLDPAWRLRRGHLLHAVLPAYQIGHEWVTGFAPLSFKSWVWQTPYAQAYATVDIVVFVLSFGLYLVAARRLVRRSTAPDARWLGRLVHGCLLILGVAVATEANRRLPIGVPGGLDWLELVGGLAYSALLYWTILTGWSHTLPRPARRPDSERTERQETYGIDADALATLVEAFHDLVAAERPHLDPDLTLPTLAGRLRLSDKELSYVLNAGLGAGYTDTINGLRVEEAKRRLADPDHADATVLEVAMDSGFASKATFNRVFKQSTGQTPTAFRAAAGRPMAS